MFLSKKRNTAGPVTQIVPTFEVHGNFPLNHNGDPISDSVDFTGGVHVDFACGARLTVGMVLPVTGPKPFDFETVAQFNFRF